MCKGETIIGHAICEEKKMSSLMKDAIKERIVTYENGEYDFPSGCNKPQFDQWLVKKCITGITFLDRPVVTTLSLKRNLM
jgi:hypothetical protein